jgi:hypothetical protein
VQSAHLTRLSKEQQEANKEEMLTREQDLICMTPVLEGFAMKNKLWCKSLMSSSLLVPSPITSRMLIMIM